MPCYTIRKTPVTFEKVAYKAGHIALLLDALTGMGYQSEADVPVLKLRSHLPSGVAVKIWPAGVAATVANTILYRDGQFQVPSTLKDRFTLDAVKQAYAREAIKLHARRHGWLLRELGPSEFEALKRG